MLAINNLCSAFRQRGNLIEITSLLDDSSQLMRNEWNNLDILLSDLDVRDYSIVHSAVLYYLLHNTAADNEHFMDLVDKVRHFIDCCCKIQIRSHCKYYLDMLQELSKKTPLCADTDIAVKTVFQALIKFQRDVGELTPIHNLLVQLAIYTKHYFICLPILENDITDVHRTVDAACCESYFYFGGMVFLAVKKFIRAQFFFELCLFNPSTNPNRVIKEAYKKYILLTIINNKMDQTPEKPLFSGRLERQIKESLKGSYVEFVHSFQCGRPLPRVREIAEAQRAIFERDGNYGIVKQCLQRYHEREVQKLTKIYASLGLSELRARLGYEHQQDAENLLFSMISRGILKAKIDTKNNSVEFKEDESTEDEAFNSGHLLVRLQEQTDVCISLQQNIQKLNNRMSVDHIYLKKMIEKEMAALR